MTHRPGYLTPEALSTFIKTALAEDVGSGDYTTLAVIPNKTQAKAKLWVKESGILAGVNLAAEIFKAIDPEVEIDVILTDGDQVSAGDVAFQVGGNAQTILSAERLVLNCMQRMSGIATYTNKLCKLIHGTSAQLIDTRKTTPNFRLMEKWAVVIGGGRNHRFALYDMIMLKDNHIELAGGIAPALTRVQDYMLRNNLSLKVEIEVRKVEEINEVLKTGGTDVIMLDNMSIQDMKLAVDRIAGKVLVEASGGITENNLLQVAQCGVDFISVGALTHSVKSLDLSLKVIP